MRHKPVAKLSRALGIALTPKAAKYLERRPLPASQSGRRPQRVGPYKERLVEKQRLRFQYNISEKQLRRAFADAHKNPEPTGLALLSDLETRLDAIVMRAGFAKTIYQARQYVSHGHINVDGARVDRPAYRLQPGQTISVRPKSQKMTPFEFVKQDQDPVTAPPYVEVSSDRMSATLTHRPIRESIPVICNEQLVVEYYAR